MIKISGEPYLKFQLKIVSIHLIAFHLNYYVCFCFISSFIAHNSFLLLVYKIFFILTSPNWIEKKEQWFIETVQRRRYVNSPFEGHHLVVKLKAEFQTLFKIFWMCFDVILIRIIYEVIFRALLLSAISKQIFQSMVYTIVERTDSHHFENNGSVRINSWIWIETEFKVNRQLEKQRFITKENDKGCNFLTYSTSSTRKLETSLWNRNLRSSS